MAVTLTGFLLSARASPSRTVVEDHGVCLSSSLDYWEDDLFLQAFSRNLILAPELYGSPWFLRDDEFPKLARVYNLARHYRDILPDGMVIKDKACGPNAVSRGNGRTRIVSLCNPTWDPATYTVTIGADIGLDGEGPYVYEVRCFHPSEEILGSFTKGQSVKVTVPAFRSQVMIVTCEPSKEVHLRSLDHRLPDTLRITATGAGGIRIVGSPNNPCSVIRDSSAT